MTVKPCAIPSGADIAPALSHIAQSAHKNRRTHWIVLVAGLIITATATLYMKFNVETIAEKEFAFHCNEIQNIISGRLYAHARILRSGVAFFNASEVTREKWHIYTKLQRIEQQLPGIQGIGFSLLIPREELTRHIQEIRSEGFPEYTVKPAGDREIYSSIIYLEPFSGRNLRAFGYDMLPEPVRRAAMELARDTDSATLSGKVVLIQETDKEVQSGVLMYVPVYHKGMPTDTVEQRRAAIYGWVYSPYRMNDLMEGILGGGNLEKAQRLHLEIFDGTQPSPQNLLYESHPPESECRRSDARFTRQIPVNFNAHRWILCFTKCSNGFFTAEYTKAWLTLVGGTLVSLLLFALILTLLNISAKAQQIAEKLTVDLRESEDQKNVILNGIPANVVLIDKELKIIWANKAAANSVNKRPEDMVGRNCYSFWGDPDKPYANRPVSKAFQTRRREHTIVHAPDGRIWDEWGEPIFNKEGNVITVVEIAQDITGRKKLEAEKAKLEEQNQQLQRAESLSLMSGAIAHIFNNQLQIVQGYLEIVIDGLPQNDSSAVKLKKALQAARKASEVSGSLLAYLGQKQVKLELLDLSELCHISLTLIQAGKPDSVAMETDFPSPGPGIRADAKQIQQILIKLSINAWESIGEGAGTIHIGVSTVSQANIPESHRFPLEWRPHEQTYACMKVADSGCGIRAKDIEKLFDPFFSTKFTGRGLGLSEVLGIVKTHNAGITVESMIGGGSVFSVFFPLSAQMAPPPD